jgi:hypothetical protein
MSNRVVVPACRLGIDSWVLKRFTNTGSVDGKIIQVMMLQSSAKWYGLEIMLIFHLAGKVGGEGRRFAN